MNKEEFEKALAEVAERLELFLVQQVDARLEAVETQQGEDNPDNPPPR